MIKIAWQMLLLPWHDGRGNNTFGNKILAWQNVCIATTMNVATMPYCHAWQRITVVARNPNTCNAKLATVAIPYCNVTFYNHWQLTRFGCNIYLLQPNWAYCNVFFVVAQGLEVSSEEKRLSPLGGFPILGPKEAELVVC